ncbi:MAG TPA: hypothetical protein VGC91_17935 [Pyrinomonadaceae bacterium]|jgi:hypothetical protein
MNSTTQSDLTTREPSETDVQPSSEEIVRSLRILLEGDEQEQRETFDYLKQALDEDRPSERRLFG